MNNQRVLITGGSGFVGTNLVEHFLQTGWAVRSFDIAAPRNPGHLGCWTELDILNRDRLIAETRSFQPNVLLHFAARTDLDERHALAGYAANIEGVANVIEAVRCTPSIERSIFASSQLVCELGYRPKDEWDYRPTTLYGQSKVESERIVRSAGEMGSMWAIVRPTSLWGPWFAQPYKNLFLAIARNWYIHPGRVRTLKQWGFVGNSVYQIDRLLSAPAESVHKKTFYLADDPPVALRDFTNQVQAELGARPIRAMPYALLKLAAWGGDAAQKVGWANPPLTSFRLRNIVTDETQDLSALRQITGPLPYTTEQGIEITVRWLRSHEPSLQPH